MLLQFNTVHSQLSSIKASETLIQLAKLLKKIYHVYKDIQKQTCSPTTQQFS
jgi:hypothetical protein